MEKGVAQPILWDVLPWVASSSIFFFKPESAVFSNLQHLFQSCNFNNDLVLVRVAVIQSPSQENGHEAAKHYALIHSHQGRIQCRQISLLSHFWEVGGNWKPKGSPNRYRENIQNLEQTVTQTQDRTRSYEAEILPAVTTALSYLFSTHSCDMCLCTFSLNLGHWFLSYFPPVAWFTDCGFFFLVAVTFCEPDLWVWIVLQSTCQLHDSCLKKLI